MEKQTKKQANENKELLDKLEFGLSIQKRIHKGWEEFENAKIKIAKKFKLTQMFGKYQYILRSSKGEISIIQIRKLNFETKGQFLKEKEKLPWEIFAHENKNLFSDTMTFKTKKKAFETAKKYLT